MSIFDQLMGLSGLYYCAECRGFHPPEQSPYPPSRGGGYGSHGGTYGGRRPTSSFPTYGPKRGGPQTGKFRDPWGGLDPYIDAIEVSGPDDGRFPTYSKPSNTFPVRPPPRRPSPITRPRSPFQDHGGYSSGNGARSGGNGGPVYNDADIPTVPKLPLIDRSKKVQPKNRHETFLNPHVLKGAGRHPYDARYPKPLSGRPTPIESMTPEEQSARAFIMTCLSCITWSDIAEDMYDLAKKGKVPGKLIEHIKFFFVAVLPHLQAKGDMAPGDYCKVRRCIDWMAEVGEVFGGAHTWSDGFQKQGGHAREGGWWRKEQAGFPDP